MLSMGDTEQLRDKREVEIFLRYKSVLEKLNK